MRNLVELRRLAHDGTPSLAEPNRRSIPTKSSPLAAASLLCWALAGYVTSLGAEESKFRDIGNQGSVYCTLLLNCAFDASFDYTAILSVQCP
jgi:hypothetical protein